MTATKSGVSKKLCDPLFSGLQRRHYFEKCRRRCSRTVGKSSCGPSCGVSAVCYDPLPPDGGWGGRDHAIISIDPHSRWPYAGEVKLGRLVVTRNGTLKWIDLQKARNSVQVVTWQPSPSPDTCANPAHAHWAVRWEQEKVLRVCVMLQASAHHAQKAPWRHRQGWGCPGTPPFPQYSCKGRAICLRLIWSPALAGCRV